MHNVKEHISRPCPDCHADGLRWTKDVLHCDACDCEWTIEDLLDELTEWENIFASRQDISKGTQ